MSQSLQALTRSGTATYNTRHSHCKTSRDQEQPPTTHVTVTASLDEIWYSHLQHTADTASS